MKQAWDPSRYASNAGFVAAYGTPLVDMLALTPGMRVLDIGCGDGVLSTELVARGASVVGIDASAEMVEAARRRGIDAHVIPAEALRFEAEFDAAFSNAALHWIRDQDAALASVRRALKPGARFVAEMGGHGNIAAISVALRAVAARRGVPFERDNYYPTDVEYRGRLERAGFAVAQISLFPRPTPLPTGMRGWLDTFAASMLEPALRDEVFREVEALLAPSLRDNAGRWTADYVRLRFVAHAL
jgi:SAM-dependent methyltransferase